MNLRSEIISPNLNRHREVAWHTHGHTARLGMSGQD